MVGHNDNVECPMVPLVGKPQGWMVGDGYGWYLGLVFHVLYLFLVLPLPLPFLSLPFPLLGFLRGGWERMSAMVTAWVLEDLLGSLFEGHVVAHLHGDGP